MAEHKKEEGGIFECKHCQVEFSSRYALKEHMQQHVQVRHTEKQKKMKRPSERHSMYHKCVYCSKRFSKPSQLQRHERIHTGEKPYQCTVCKKTFSQKGSLQLHLKTHDELRPFKCNQCPMRFGQKGNLRAHVAVSSTKYISIIHYS